MNIAVSVLLILLIGLKGIFAREADTLRFQQMEQMQRDLDSLRQQIRSLQEEMQQVKSRLAQEAEWDKILSEMQAEPEESDQAIPEDKRSRRSRVDALLKVMDERPGHLRFNGGATATIQGNPSGEEQFTAGVGSFDIFAHTSFGDNTLLFIDWEGIGGNGPDEHIQACN